MLRLDQSLWKGKMAEVGLGMGDHKMTHLALMAPEILLTRHKWFPLGACRRIGTLPPPGHDRK